VGRRLIFLLVSIPLGLLTVFLAGIMLMTAGIRWLRTGQNQDHLLLWNPPLDLLERMWAKDDPDSEFDNGGKRG
jgi:hypothetical protein